MEYIISFVSICIISSLIGIVTILEPKEVKEKELFILRPVRRKV